MAQKEHFFYCSLLYGDEYYIFFFVAMMELIKELITCFLSPDPILQSGSVSMTAIDCL